MPNRITRGNEVALLVNNTLDENSSWRRIAGCTTPEGPVKNRVRAAGAP
ncbi:MAG: hypothetical protein AVDCRST_MAG78-1932 [uncultured Rubrobacteraceae bacterium]|uniref:Uncharacterized protein n=1 Tax=uncultured Rubrobacteraceae bacterium TaxID=349277 RepID=A0A6J4QA28_9ACTN|nr:MAG: hypothetical protein AVDCRST_MAG78-1932 [uncultured Rubrobacteraceae bacterium]